MNTALILSSFSRRKFLALRIAACTVASGFSFEPIFASEPFGETYMLAALPTKANSKKYTSRHGSNRFIPVTVNAIKSA
jgi:hypothetical protein